ncbi:MAG: hypothetical protein PsegKO_22850 [Pseudohongiellaceae bacterium]
MDCLLVICLVAVQLSGGAEAASTHAVAVTFDDSEGIFSAADKALINAIVRQTGAEVRALLPDLPEGIRVSVAPLARDLGSVGGVTGRADNPNTVVVYVATVHEGGVEAAINTGLAPVLYHEFHHLVRGWTIAGNKFGPGITVAAINEGLANVFSETYTRTAFTGNAYPANVSQWWEEISELPVDASYSDWMVRHPDGREAIAYKAGSFIIRQALALSSHSILELSQMPVADILALVDERS